MLVLTVAVSIVYSVFKVTGTRAQQAVVLRQETLKDIAFFVFASALTAYLWVLGGADRFVTSFDELLLLLGLYCGVYWVPFFGFRWFNERNRR